MFKNFSRIALAAIIILFIFSREAADLLVNWWWLQEIGNTVYFIRSLELKAALFSVVFLLMLLPSLITLILSRKIAPMKIRVLEGNILEFPEHLIRPYLFPLLYLATGFISFLTAVQAASNWPILLPLIYHPNFHIVDPIFHKNVSFYAFFLPIITFFYQILFASFLMALILAITSYGIQKVLSLTQDGVKMHSVVTAHLSILLGILALIKGAGYSLGMYDELLTQHHLIFGAGYTQLYATIPLLKVITIIAIITALLLFINAKVQTWKPVIPMAGLWILCSITLVAYPALIEKFRVIPSELRMEKPFLKNMIAFTRKAYGLQNVIAKEIHATSHLNQNDVQTHAATFRNIRIWDRSPLLKTLAQMQEIRPYYKFPNADVDRYVIHHHLKELILSVRELDYSHLPNKSWINNHLIFTHGYGIVATPVNQVTSHGLPIYYLRNIPPIGVPELKVAQPEVYYGEFGRSYAIVNTNQSEFNYPYGNKNKWTHYHGTGGVSLNSFFKRLIFAYHFSYEILFASALNSHSKIMYHRQIQERLKKAFPLLIYDSDPYPVIDHGKLYWICDAYTINKYFPYSQPIEFHGHIVNYIRNPVKVVINAYNGTLKYYIVDPNDPIIQMYSKEFPNLFHPFSQMPKSLKAHIRVPENFFLAQAEVYTLYHMTDPNVFYNREDLWQFSHQETGGIVKPYYVLMQLPGDKKPEFLIMVPFTPYKKDNMEAWFAARCDPPYYGQRLVFEFSKDRLVFGPSQVQARINQDPRFSKLRTLLGQQGSNIQIGHLQVIPIHNVMLYVEPIYLEASQRELPELKLVLVAYGNRIEMDENLKQALASLFGVQNMAQNTAQNKKNMRSKKGMKLPSEEISKIQKKLNEAYTLYQKAIQDERNMNWGKYGIEIKKLGTVLGKLVKP